MKMSDVTPIGHCVLIEPEKVKEKVGSIIVITGDGKKYEQQAQVKGKVLAVGHDAWQDMIDQSVKVGDIVYYQRHAGMRLPDENGNPRLDRLVLKDLDIVAKE